MGIMFNVYPNNNNTYIECQKYDPVWKISSCYIIFQTINTLLMALKIKQYWSEQEQNVIFVIEYRRRSRNKYFTWK